MTPEEEGFRVTDRRRQAPEASETTPEGPSPVRETRSPSAAAISAEPERPAGPLGAGDELDLKGLFVMFASSALIGLGATPNPMTGERTVDLEQAKEAIDTLLLLRDKTRGNRTEEESRLLEEILYDLQLRFVQASGAGPRP